MAEDNENFSIIDDILRKGSKLADDIEVFFSEGFGVGLELKGRLIGEAEGSESWGIGIRVVKDGKIGCSSTNDPKCFEMASANSPLGEPPAFGPITLQKRLWL